MPDFDVSGAFPWTFLFAHAGFPGSKGCSCPLFMGHLGMSCLRVQDDRLQQPLLQKSDSNATPSRVLPQVKALDEVVWAGAGEGDLIQLPADLLGPPKGMSASEEGGEAVEPAGSQVQSGESGSLPHVRRPALLLLQ